MKRISYIDYFNNNPELCEEIDENNLMVMLYKDGRCPCYRGDYCIGGVYNMVLRSCSCTSETRSYLYVRYQKLLEQKEAYFKKKEEQDRLRQEAQEAQEVRRVDLAKTKFEELKLITVNLYDELNRMIIEIFKLYKKYSSKQLFINAFIESLVEISTLFSRNKTIPSSDSDMELFGVIKMLSDLVNNKSENLDERIPEIKGLIESYNVLIEENNQECLSMSKNFLDSKAFKKLPQKAGKKSKENNPSTRRELDEKIRIHKLILKEHQDNLRKLESDLKTVQCDKVALKSLQDEVSENILQIIQIFRNIEDIILNHIKLCSNKYDDCRKQIDNVECFNGHILSISSEIEYANKLMENFNTSTPIIISDIDKILSTSLFLLSGTDVTIDNLSEYIKTLLQPLKAFISDSRLVDCSVQVVSCVSDVGV